MTIKPNCLMPGCENPQNSRGQCTRHYQQTVKAIKAGEITWESQIEKGLANPSMLIVSPINRSTAKVVNYSIPLIPNKIIVALPYCQKDAHLMLGMLKWIQELGSAKSNDCILITDPASLSGADDWPNDPIVAEIEQLARTVFASVICITTPYRRKRLDGTSAWPMGANWCFYSLAFYMAMTQTRPFLFLEPDCSPIKEGWLDIIEKEYLICGKPMLGPILQTKMPDSHPSYMNGTAVYPAKGLLYFDGAFIDFLNGGGHAFDVAAAARVIPEAFPTRLIQHFWGSAENVSPTFVKEKKTDDPWNVFTLEHIYPEAVLYHRDKTGSLISLLRERRNKSKVS